MRRRARYVGSVAAVWLALLGWAGRARSEEAAAEKAPPVVFGERFSSPTLDEKVWKITRQNDFQESTIDLVGADEASRRLRLRAATLDTDDRTVKFHGVRTVEPAVDFSEPIEVSVEIDWNKQANGCYLTAGLFLCPQATDTNPCDQPDWLGIEYIGVPPGKNGRCLVASKVNGGLRHLFTEGWPDEQRTGRAIGLQKLRLRIDATSLKVFENGKELAALPRHRLRFTKAYLCLQMSSHSNYPPREVFFDNVEVRKCPPEPAEKPAPPKQTGKKSEL